MSKQTGRLEEFFVWLGKVADSTKSGYNTNIWLFLKDRLNLKDEDRKNLSSFVDEYFNSSPDVYKDFRQYLIEYISKKPALSAKQSYNTLKVFFEVVTDTPFTPKQVKALKNQLPSGSESASEETDFTQADIRSILQHCDIKMKAIVLCLASGGMRISDLLDMYVTDVKFDTTPVQIVVGNKKTNAKPRTAFITSEASQAVKEWLKVREEYLKSTSDKALNFKDASISAKQTDNKFLFPVSQQSVNEAFKEAVIKAFNGNETDRLTNRSKRHIHGLRKFCSSMIAYVGTNQGIVDKIIGHKTALSKAYDRWSVEQLAEWYLKAEPKLLIEAPAELIDTAIKTNDRIEALRGASETNQALINGLQLERMNQEKRIQTLTEQMQGLTEQIEKINEMDKLRQALQSQPDIEKVLLQALENLKKKGGSS